MISSAFNPDQSAYRELIDRCLLNAPDFSGVTEIADLPELDPNDISLIQRVKGLTEIDSLKSAQESLLEDVRSAWENRNEQRAMARDDERFERYHGGDTPYNERESDESYYGMGRAFR